jgi:transposase
MVAVCRPASRALRRVRLHIIGADSFKRSAVRLLPPSYVKAYLKRSKNDANDTAAIRAHALLQRYSRTHAIPFGTLDVERVPLSAQKKLIAEREEEER